MSPQVLMQARVILDVLGIIDEGRILVELLGDLGMRVHVAIGARQRMRAVVLAVVFVVALASHEAVGMMLELLADFRMVLEVLVETRMSGQELRIVHQPWITGKLLCHFGMLVEVAVVKPADLAARDSVAAIAIVVMAPFVAHEAVGMLLQILPYFRMFRQKLVEAGMSGEELRVVRQRRIGAQLTGHFGMLVEVAVVEATDGTGDRRRADGADKSDRRESCNAFFHDHLLLSITGRRRRNLYFRFFPVCASRRLDGVA